MKRTTVLLPDDLAYLLERERRRRGVSTAAIVREAVAAHFNISSEPRRISFAAIGDSGLTDLGENFERYLDEAWGSEEFYNRTMGRYPDADRGTNSKGDSAPDRGPDATAADTVSDPVCADQDVDAAANGD